MAGLLLAIELAQPSFDGLLFAALGALLVSIITAITPIGLIGLILQLILFLLITATGTLWLTRWSSRRNPSPEKLRLREDVAEVLTPIAAGGDGRVRWHGQSWAASSIDLETKIDAGDQVVVMGREGNKLQILPMPQR
ncbi:MAG: NfeD family protein [Prochlorococcus sp.]|nr:NfeD family protein [Prochlorococcaceae cyanobacterium ETNP2_MAG_10]